ncbi:hypothetical protein SUGI_0715590 [Cryptomeria japonica]|uniref:L-type lectin-domain containing receptor kinase IX.1 n=1 Tax=Cryptomeria japonica TaxID=3369 RepID=UPI00241496D1|nr:L-type lectin-domain containing receptor kinase IX.1 [Cryptomeria japonica]GLJ35598.1 hypothetical protein SUGI_0715590 [Cryptomeria japonica]
MAHSISTALAIYIVAQCFLFKISVTEAENVPISFKLDGDKLVRRDGDAVVLDDNVIQLTNNERGLLSGTAGRVVYDNPIPLWNASNKSFANFTTHFQFQINWTRDNVSGYDDYGGDGLAFFMASPDTGYNVPYSGDGGWLGLFSRNNNGNLSNHLVAVEFDTYNSSNWDKNDNHIGIDVNNITSEVSVPLEQRLNNSKIWDARIDYLGRENMLVVYAGSNGTASRQLSHKINLTKYLPEQIVVGFSAAAVESSEIHRLISWNFTSVISSSSELQSSEKRKVTWKAFILVGSGLLIAVIFVSFTIYKWRNKEKNHAMEDEEQPVNVDIDMEIAMEHVPRKFTYEELTLSTSNFSEEKRLGRGGFGDVYKGILVRSNEIVAVKRISAGSKQGKKEYLAEISTINRLRHRNLVQLLGWCHEKAQLLLVYEYMPNGSLDNFLFGERRGEVEWSRRYGIATDIANALLYLHELWDECVVHRDIKSSNVLLDAQFNAKLGDFGLARLVKHDQWLQTTKVAGTLGYLAPECAVTGISSPESDVFSFGAVALEIACGRPVLDHSLQSPKVRLVEWVWEMYGEGRLFDAADKNLEGVFDRAELEQLVVIGLWCSHPDPSSRPKIRQVLQLLHFEVPLPRLPSTLPKATYSPLEQAFYSQSSDFTVSTDIPSTSTHFSASTSSSIGMPLGR